MYSYDRVNLILVESARKGRDQSRMLNEVSACRWCMRISESKVCEHEVGRELTSVARECSGQTSVHTNALTNSHAPPTH